MISNGTADSFPATGGCMLGRTDTSSLGWAIEHAVFSFVPTSQPVSTLQPDGTARYGQLRQQKQVPAFEIKTTVMSSLSVDYRHATGQPSLRKVSSPSKYGREYMVNGIDGFDQIVIDQYIFFTIRICASKWCCTTCRWCYEPHEPSSPLCGTDKRPI